MREEDTTREWQGKQTINGDVSYSGTIRTADKGLAAYLDVKGFSPDFLYTKEERPDWVYLCFEIGDEEEAQKLVIDYYRGRDTVDAYEYQNSIDAVFSWIGMFKRKHPQGGRWNRDKTAKGQEGLRVYLESQGATMD